MNRIKYPMRASGLFSEVNNAVGAALFCEAHQCGFFPVWDRCRYTKHGVDGWPVYFAYERPTDGKIKRVLQKDEPAMRPFRRCIAPRYPEQPKEYVRQYGCPVFLRDPLDRHLAQRALHTYCQWSQPVWEAIMPWLNWLGAYPWVIGVHCRGPLRLHGGTGYLADKLGQGRPPYPAYFSAIERELTDKDVILLCTDAGCVVEAFRERYGERLLVPSLCTPDDGEPHIKAAADPWDLAIDVITDAMLLAQSRLFIHGNSNISNFVLCESPELKHHDIYASVYPEGGVDE